jgi:hypothetical protein
MYPHISFPITIVKVLKDIERGANKARIPTSSTLYNHQRKILYVIYIAACILAIIAFIFFIKKNLIITIICFNIILVLVGVINFVEHKNQVSNKVNANNNNQLYKKNITLKRELLKNLVSNSTLLLALISPEKSSIKNDSFNQFLFLNGGIDSFLNKIEELFPGKIYYSVKFNTFDLSSNPIVIIEYNPLFIAIFIDIPYTIEHRNDDYLRVRDSSNSQDEYILNNLGLISITFSEEQILKSMLSCSEYICRLIVRFTSDINLLDKVNNQVPNLIQIQQWDISDTVHLENQKYREEYLKQTDG